MKNIHKMAGENGIEIMSYSEFKRRFNIKREIRALMRQGATSKLTV